MRTVHVVVPAWIDDPVRPSGGNTYDRRLCRGLRRLGWSVHEHPAPGDWPRPDAAAFAKLSAALQGIAQGAVVLLDGLIACAAPEALAAQADRLRLVVLVHMPLGHRPPAGAADDSRRREGAVLSAAAAVITTSAWTRRRLLELYDLPAGVVQVAHPGVDPAELAGGGSDGSALLCVGAVTFEKGHDVLLDALQTIAEQPWRLECVGSLDRDPAFVADLRRRCETEGLGDRVRFPGPRTGRALDRTYAAAELMVLASRAETYGMALTEALARGLPVVATDVGGVTEALGTVTGGTRPGLLVAPEDPGALAGALRGWLADAELRARLRRAAAERRTALAGWPATASIVADVLTAAAR